MAKFYVANIDWDTDNDYWIKKRLPEKVSIDDFELLYHNEKLSDVDTEELKDRIADFLCDEYGYCVFGFSCDYKESKNRKSYDRKTNKNTARQKTMVKKLNEKTYSRLNKNNKYDRINDVPLHYAVYFVTEHYDGGRTLDLIAKFGTQAQAEWFTDGKDKFEIVRV